MIDFEGTPPFLRIALRVAMATMHYHIVQTGLFLGALFLHTLGILRNNLAPMRNCLWNARLVKLDARVYVKICGCGLGIRAPISSSYSKQAKILSILL